MLSRVREKEDDALTREQELEAVRLAQQGDMGAFEDLVRAYEKLVYNLALNMTGNVQDAEDASQEAFLKAFNSLDQFRGESKFSVWLYRITSNVCLDALRKKARRPEQSLTQEDGAGESIQMELPDLSFSPEQLLERSLTVDALRRGLALLPEQHRQILLLREISGLSYEEIGSALALEPGTVKSRLFRARKNLCDFLIKDGNIPDWISSRKVKGGVVR